MKRRDFLLGGAVIAAGLAWWMKPGDRGAPYTEYFRALNRELKAHGSMQPSMLIDLDRLDHNIDQVAATLRNAGKAWRIVEKSLPSHKLIDYISRRANTRRLMSFHQPFLSLDTEFFPDFDVLMGKPLPARAAQRFYSEHKPGGFDPSRQLQWLIDTPQRLAEYLQLAQGLGTKLLVNIELDVGLHRGGIADEAPLRELLDVIAANPLHLEFGGFMGYDAHVGMGVPAIFGSAPELLSKAMAIYARCVDFTRREYPQLWRNDLTLNAGGSPSYTLHPRESISNDISTGTALLKPSHYDLDTLSAHVPAAYIATPVLKKTGPIRLPALDDKSKIFSWWDPNQRETFFVYGGWWRADFASPRGLQLNEMFGRSANQELVNASPAVGLHVGDQIFLRPQISESVLLEFGDLVILRGGKIVDSWPVFQAES
ncbi:DSD1 family PLP-dependent enzyme [Dyella solisilvae]|uniref:DSD1 family PLP-dependent enzyme n=1 Tax=Dyella solisilvae TaxID=1920168 RepID=A0A370K2E0_9GAMM|nr:alanine racemase [Dyella solisilvae]RDI96814.1 DSD1 family PLP-dependent enzyme [Dyella solisilvae]